MHTFVKIEREADAFIVPVNSASAKDQTKSCDHLFLERQQQNYIIIIRIEVLCILVSDFVVNTDFISNSDSQ